jgi:streptomycin 6-kinase
MEEHARHWGVDIHDTSETETSLLAFGIRAGQPVALKVLRQAGDEWRSGKVLNAFKGSGVVRVYEYVEGAVLLERLVPGQPLLHIVLRGDDDRATEILAGVIQSMETHTVLTGFTTVVDWSRGFERYLQSGDAQIPKRLVEHGQQIFSQLSCSQQRQQLLHGDLHHHNVLFDTHRGWLAIDPKGVVGEIEYEIGAALRNPVERPELFISAKIIEKRVRRFAEILRVSALRTLEWSFAQAVLSAIWEVEDGHVIDAKSPPIQLANTICSMIRTQ